MQLVTECAIGFVGSAVLMSFIEHQIHQTMMHRKHILSKPIKALERVFKHHAVLHHGHYKASFTDEPVPRGEDHGIRLNMREGFLKLCRFHCLLLYFRYRRR